MIGHERIFVVNIELAGRGAIPKKPSLEFRAPVIDNETALFKLLVCQTLGHSHHLVRHLTLLYRGADRKRRLQTQELAMIKNEINMQLIINPLWSFPIGRRVISM